MSSVPSDEDLMKNVFQLKERLMQTETSLQKINRMTELDAEIDPGIRMSFSEPYLQGASESLNLPPPLTLDDLGELTTHDETDYSPINESVLRQWNLNNKRSTRSQHSKTSRSPSPEFRSKSSRPSSESIHSANGFQRNLKNLFSPRKLMGPATSSPNVARHAQSRAYSCDDLTSATDLELYSSDSYRMLKQPSVTSNFSTSAPISPRKNMSHNRRRDPSPSYSDTLDRHSGPFERMEGVPSDHSAIESFTLMSSDKSPTKDDSADTTILEQGKENVTPRPISARSNATSVTMLGADAESDRLRGRLSMLREDNTRLHALVSDLRQHLEEEKLRKDDRHTTKVMENLRETILSLKEEAHANENALRRAEESLEHSEMVCQKKIETVISLKDEVSHIKSILTQTELAKESLTKQHREAFEDAQELARQLESSHEKLNAAKKEREKSDAHYLQEIRALEKFKSGIGERAAKLQHSNSQLQSDLRKALLQLEARENNSNERDNEKMHISVALQDLQARFGDLRNDLKRKADELEKAENDRASLRQKLDTLDEQNHLQQDRLSSCQQELEDARTEVAKLEKNLRKSKQEQCRFYGTGNAIDSGRGASVAFSDQVSTRNNAENVDGELASPRKQKAIIAELKMKLAAKEAQIQRLEARVNNFTVEAERLEEIRGELINVVERSRMGEKRAHELEGIVHQLEDERSKVMRQLMETEDKLNDKNAECDSLESRLHERTRNLTRIQHEHEEGQKQLNKLESDLKKSASDIEHLEKQLERRTVECESRYAALQRAEEELADKRRELDNAAEWTGKRETESRRDVDKMKKIHQEQHKEMEIQIEKLQSERDRHREQARELECVVCQLRAENDTIAHLLKTSQTELEDARELEESTRRKDEDALESLQKKATESSEQVTHLHSALTQCKADIRQYVDQLEEASSKFQHQMSVKNAQVAKLESEMNILQESVRSESLHAKALETNLTERQKMLEEASVRISELEDCQSCLQAKAAKLEQQLIRESSKSSQERDQWESRFQAACCQLDAKNRQFGQLNEALKDVDKEFGSCRKELASVEQQLNKLRADAEDKTKQLEKAQIEANEFKSELDTKTQAVLSLEERVKSAEIGREEFHGKCLTLETELTRCRAELQSLTQNGGQLQSALQAKDIEVMKKDTFISRLQSALKEAKEKLETKEHQTDELERALEDRQWELQQRAAQIGQLDVNVREHKSNAEKKQIELQSDVRKAHIELRERNAQICTLDEQMTSLREELSEERHQLEEKQQDLRRGNRELEQRDERVKDLEKALEEARAACEERHRACLEVTQELRVAREQSQRSSQQWQDAQRELSRLQRQQENLIVDLEDMGKNERQKEGHVSELAGKLAASQAEKAGVEERYVNELERMRNDVLKMHQQHQEEIARLRNEHEHQITSTKTQAGDRSEDLKNALEREKQSREESAAMCDVVTSLEQELLARKQVIEAANDTIVMKEAEIARLEARLSVIGREKRMQVMQNSPVKPKAIAAEDQPDFLPSFLVRDVEGSPAAEPDWQSPLKLEESPVLQHGTSTLFSGLDPDSSSLGPSFIHIAASTKRPQAVDNDLARALAMSPGQDLSLANSDADESLFARVFNNTGATDPMEDEIHRAPYNGSDFLERPNTRGRQGATVHAQNSRGGELRPEQCMADLRGRLRASEQRRQEVTTKLRQLKSSNGAKPATNNN